MHFRGMYEDPIVLTVFSTFSAHWLSCSWSWYSRHTLIPLRTTATRRGHLFIFVRGPIHLPYDATPSRQKKRANIFSTHVVRPSNTTTVLFILRPPVSLSFFLKSQRIASELYNCVGWPTLEGIVRGQDRKTVCIKKNAYPLQEGEGIIFGWLPYKP